jgi:hypothetical protein
MKELNQPYRAAPPLRRSRRRIRSIGFVVLASVGLSFAAFGIGSACNYGVFASPTNAGPTECKCICGNSFDPNSGDSCTSLCQAPFDSDEKLAHKAGCDGQFNGYSECLIDHGTCRNHTFDAAPCGPLLSALTDCEASGLGAGGAPP